MLLSVFTEFFLLVILSSSSCDLDSLEYIGICILLISLSLFIFSQIYLSCFTVSILVTSKDVDFVMDFAGQHNEYYYAKDQYINSALYLCNPILYQNN